MKDIKLILLIALGFFLVNACSTEKNTLINRTYHGINAHYNGYFNANELIRQSLETYSASRVENYYELIPIDPLPNETEIIGMYPAIDTAIGKCKKVIQDHSMPSNDRPARKKDEHNKWIDENWTTIGIASYYRRDYDGAMKSFNFVRKFYSNDPSLFVGELWMAKTNIAKGELTKAKFNLDNLDKAILDEKTRKKEKPAKSKLKKKSKEDKIAKFPRSIRFELEKTKAELALARDEKEKAIEYLENSLDFAQIHDDKARVHFVLGQLYEENGLNDLARKHFTSVAKGKAKYDMSFNAKLKRTFLGEGDNVRKDLKKMLRDAKNAEFKDQIYYALANLEFNEGNESKGIEHLTNCAFYATNNSRQKGMAYERLADLSFSKRNYVSAQKYYDSCATAINDEYPNAEGIRNKAANLSKLVIAVETAQFEDSVQKIAAMGEDDRSAFLKELVKIKKAEAQRKKEREAERLRELQNNANLFAQDLSGSKWYWNNAKTRSQGFEEFKKLWGVRENEDDWRRSEKDPIIDFSEQLTDNAQSDTIQKVSEDSISVELLAKDLPLNDSLLSLSNIRLLEAYYNAGVIYKEQLNESKLAEEQFVSVLNRNVENPHNLLAAYQLYKIHEKTDVTKAEKHKEYILNNYPNSDYANYLRDPDYFVKKKERDALAEQEYVRVLDRYDRGLYYPVMTKADQVINDEKDNVFRAKYILLKAMCIGMLNEDKSDIVPLLDMVVAEYPGTSEQKKASEMLFIIKNGYSKFEPTNFGNKSSFKYDDNVPLSVFIVLPEKESSNSGKIKVIEFNKEFFSRAGLKVTSKLYSNEQSFVFVDQFKTEAEASEYIRVYKQTRKHLFDLQNAKIMMITSDNMRVLFKNLFLQNYEKFYEEYY